MNYEYKKTLKKIGKAAVYVIIAGLASVYGDSQIYLAIAPILSGLENYIKNK